MHSIEIISEENNAKIGTETVRIVAEKTKSLFQGRCQRILLINIPQVSEENFDIDTAKLGRYYCFPPFGPGLLSRNLRDAGYQTMLLDLNFTILSQVNMANFHYKLWQSEVQKAVDNFVPDLIGVSCMFSMTHTSMRTVVEYIKKHYSHIPIVTGGVHISNNTAMVLKDIPCIDLALCFEADVAIVNMVDFVNMKKQEKDLSQIATIVNGEYFEVKIRNIPGIQNINSSPDYDALPIGQYSTTGSIGGYHWLRTDHPPIATSRANIGCRAACTFCSVRSFNGIGVRSRNSIAVVDEMQRMMENYGIQHFMWLDDDLFRPEAATDLFPEITKRNLGATWDASNGVIASASTPEMIQAASESGCIGLSFGVESGSPEILKAVKKPSMIKHFMRVSEILKNYPQIFSKGFLMVGFPDETICQIRSTVNLAVEMALDWYPIQVLSPFGGTAIAKELINKGVIDEYTILSSNMFAGVTGKLRTKERSEVNSSIFNSELLDSSEDQTRIPSKDEMADIWFLMDYRVNYEQIQYQTNRTKLTMKRLLLKDVRDRVPKHIPMASLFLGIINQKLGNHSEAEENFKETRLYLRESVFWKIRFEGLGLIKRISSQL